MGRFRFIQLGDEPIDVPRPTWWQQRGTFNICKAVNKAEAARIIGCYLREITFRSATNEQAVFFRDQSDSS